MIDFETFLTELYVMVDDFCKSKSIVSINRGSQLNLASPMVQDERLGLVAG